MKIDKTPKTEIVKWMSAIKEDLDTAVIMQPYISDIRNTFRSNIFIGKMVRGKRKKIGPVSSDERK